MKEVFSLNKLLLSLIESGSIKCVLWDADGVLYDAERFSHYALHDGLAKYNEILVDREVMSDRLVGVTVQNQLEIVKQLYAHQGITLNLPDDLQDLNDFRDERQSELFIERNLQAIEGVFEVLETLKQAGIAFAIVTSSRYQPMIEKIKQTGLDKYFTPENTFYKAMRESTEAVEYIEEYARKHSIRNDLTPIAKTRDFIYAAAKMGFSPNECVGIEDTAGGVISIINAGMTAVSFVGAEDTSITLATGTIPPGYKYYLTDKMV